MATVRKRGNSYNIRVSCGYDITGKQIEHTLTWKPEPNMTEKQVQKELERQKVLFEERCRTGQVLDGSIRFADFAERWFKEYAEIRLRPRTIAGYRGFMPLINAAIGHVRLEKLQPHYLAEFYHNLQEKGVRRDVKYIAAVDLKVLIRALGSFAAFAKRTGLGERTVSSAANGNGVTVKTAHAIADALELPLEEVFIAKKETHTLEPASVRKCHCVISSMLGNAVKQQIIFSNPCERVELPRHKPQQSAYLDEYQTAELLDLLQSAPIQYRTAIQLLLYTGMRRGELLGLEWKDIDFEKSVMQIRRTSQYLPHLGVFCDETKNRSSSRAIKISPSALALLRPYRTWQLQERLKLGDQWHDHDRLFTTWNGEPIHPDTITSWFREFIDKTDLPPIHVHSLRHTNATLLIAAGTNVQAVASRLGHSDANTTNKIYAHAIQTADAVAAEVLEDILHPTRNKA